ncbi:MAG: hypothetical protein PHO27_01780 [Sulfuricurvum sp.]|nr:hypothetical protein [Sulfuricurvum sp.]
MSFFTTTILFIALFFSGCSTLFNSTDKTVEEKKIIYKNVTNEIDFLKERGEKSLEEGYYTSAATDFKMVNYYKDAPVIPIEKIEDIQYKAKISSKYHYERGMKLLHTNKKEALIEFNKMVQNDPSYKDGKEQFNKLRTDEQIVPFLASLEKSVNDQLKKNFFTINALAKLNRSTLQLLEYNHESTIASTAKNIIKDHQKEMIDESVSLYNEQKFDVALEHFQLLKEIYGKDKTVQKYLDKYAFKKEVETKLKLAKHSLNTRKYPLAIKYSESILEIDPNNNEAKNILINATNKHKAILPHLLYKGITYYNKHELNNALKIFQSILEMDPTNPTATVYIKKITQQLETIKCLK